MGGPSPRLQPPGWRGSESLDPVRVVAEVNPSNYVLLSYRGGGLRIEGKGGAPTTAGAAEGTFPLWIRGTT